MYACPNCDYITSRKSSLSCHLRRKRPCVRRITPSQQQDSSNGRSQQTQPLPATSYKCDQCEACFKFRSNLSRHKKTAHCGTIVSHSEEKENDDQITNLKQEVERLREEVSRRPSTTTTNTNTHNITNNTININALGRENISGLTPEIITTCIKRTSKGLADLVEKIHFDATMNRNIRATLQHPEHVEYFDGDRWKVGPRNRVMRQVVDSSHNIMSDHYDNNSQDVRNSMTISLFTFVHNWMQKMTRSNARAYADAMDEVYCCVLNRTRDFTDPDTDSPDPGANEEAMM